MTDELTLDDLTAPTPAPQPMSNVPWKRRREMMAAAIAPYIREQQRTGKHEPNDIFRNAVLVMSAMGSTDEMMALVLQISPGTLRKYYDDEIRLGVAQINLEVSASYVDMALDPENKSAVNACQWWLERRGGDRFKPPAKDVRLDATVTEQKPVIDVTNLTYEERQQFKAMLMKIEAPKLIGQDDPAEDTE